MAKSSINQRLSREKAVQRYLAALEEGDFSAIAAVWQEADGNPALEHLLFQLHETFPNGQELLAWDESILLNENSGLKKEYTMLKQDMLQEKETGSLNSFPSDKRSSARLQRRGPILVRALAAILLAAFIVGGFLVAQNWNALRPKPASTPVPSITPRPTQTPLVQMPSLCQVALPAAYQTHTSLNDLLVLSHSDIWLVGDSVDQSFVVQPLALHWNGATWSSTSVPAPAGSILSQLAATSASDIWAIGETDYGSGIPNGGAQPSHTLIEHWNGDHWSQIASPDLLPSTRNLLQGVAVITPENVWAVGVAGNDITNSGYGTRTSPLVEHWDGTRWQLVTLPTIQSAGLNSIVALNANDIWAAGSSSDNNGTSHSPLLLHWNGQNWSSVATLTINSGASGSLLKITADASHHLLALGFDQNGMPLLLSLRNGQWDALPVPPTAKATGTATFYNQFLGISATSSQDIWLAGASVQVPKSDGASVFTPLVEHWNGHQWQAVSEHYRGQASLQTISISTGITWSSGSIDAYGHPFLATTCQ